MRLIYCLQSVNQIGSEKLHFLVCSRFLFCFDLILFLFFTRVEIASSFLFSLALHYLILFILFIACVQCYSVLNKERTLAGFPFLFPFSFLQTDRAQQEAVTGAITAVDERVSPKRD